jgi:division protein CdvB (Snf7/Vps24/ESCRT-III family)
MQAIIDTKTRLIQSTGTFPTPPDDPALAIVTLTDAEAAKLRQPGVKTVAEDGTVSVFLDPAIVAAEQAAETALQGVLNERTAATDDVRTTAATAMTRLDAIVTQMGQVSTLMDTAATLAQVRGALKAVAEAVGDEAAGMKRLVRLLNAQMG